MMEFGSSLPENARIGANELETTAFTRRFINFLVLISLCALFFICLFKPHPASPCAHDAKWCVFGIWLAMMAYQLFETAKACKLKPFEDFSLCCSLGIESVVLGWTIAAFQNRMSTLRVSKQTLPCLSRSWVPRFVSGARGELLFQYVASESGFGGHAAVQRFAPWCS
ncbi:unnamed protein product [Durusdinium trenchii]|uniref:Uncharacterized protein n=1 Tax=Durusdinium trenchii TaxID=1381693 RepID=A0ABP0LJV1_9DINO